MNKNYHAWCKQWVKYDEAKVEEHWVNCDPSKRPHGYGMASLRRWAQEDNPDAYRQLHPDTIPVLDNDSKVYLHQLGDLKDKYDYTITRADVPMVRREI